MIWIRFIAALAVAGWHRCQQSSGCLKIAWNSIQSLWMQPKGGHPKQVDRMKSCQDCPLFYKPLMTCGSPLQTAEQFKDHEGNLMGCFCFMPFKARTKCNCWLYDESGGVMGWAQELNDFPPEK